MVVSLSLKTAILPVPFWLTDKPGELDSTSKEAAPEYTWAPWTCKSPWIVVLPWIERLPWAVIVPVVWRFPFSSIVRVEVPKVAPFSKVAGSLKVEIKFTINSSWGDLFWSPKTTVPDTPKELPTEREFETDKDSKIPWPDTCNPWFET